MRISDIDIDLSIYPRKDRSEEVIGRYMEAIRSGRTLPPVVVEKGTNRLLDGLHRVTAMRHLECVEVEAEEHEVPEGVPALLYAASLSAEHGYNIPTDELRAVARIMAKRDVPTGVIASHFSKSESTIRSWTATERNHNRELRNVRAKLLSRAGWSQKRIVEELDWEKSQVSRELQNTDDPRNENPNLIDEAAAPYDDDVLAEAEAWKEEIAEAIRRETEKKEKEEREKEEEEEARRREEAGTNKSPEAEAANKQAAEEERGEESEQTVGDVLTGKAEEGDPVELPTKDMPERVKKCLARIFATREVVRNDPLEVAAYAAMVDVKYVEEELEYVDKLLGWLERYEVQLQKELKRKES